ncbi:TPA: glucose-1-phosphate thymidylyltransferase RfbA [Candidatus Galligastranaerophilus faecipullorum]|nr:glucose-1-phosphate thymidylyltransferase RfbA [Candidatus Galligastranaerophilus faecipullorum]
MNFNTDTKKCVKKGIVLAGGAGTRLYPSTISVSKQLLPVYDKPMIYYPISVLMLAGIKDILIISTPEDIDNFKKLLKDGSDLGVNFTYAIQPSPDGLAQAFIIGEDFISNEPVALILGDNIFYGQSFSKMLEEASQKVSSEGGATIFAYKVKDASRYGIVEFDKQNKVKCITEKPENPKSDYAVTGLYFYDGNVAEYAKTLKPSKRGELEITDLNNIYLKNSSLDVKIFGRGFSWLDTGTHASLMQAGQYIKTIEDNQGIKIACLEEIAYKMGYLTKDVIRQNISRYKNNDYYTYILNLLK